MEFIQLTCPNCHASLNVEDSLDTIYCKYCGTKLILHGQDPEVVNAKLQLKMADKIFEYEQEERRQRNKEADNDMKYILILLVFLLVIAIVCHYLGI